MGEKDALVKKGSLNAASTRCSFAWKGVCFAQCEHEWAGKGTNCQFPWYFTFAKNDELILIKNEPWICGDTFFPFFVGLRETS